MSDTFGFGTDTTGFSSTVHDAIQKQVIDTLRAGLICLPKGAVVPASIYAQKGENFTLRLTDYPDLEDAATTVPLDEGVAPEPVILGIDTLDYTVQQVGAWTKITDIAQFQSPHPLFSIARDKIARLAVQTIDNLALTAIAAHGIDEQLGGAVLSTSALLDAVAELAARDVEPIPGVGYYCLLHPFALRGLTGEDGLNGWVDVAAHAGNGDLTSGAVGQYRGVTFLTSTRLVADLIEASYEPAYPCIFLGKNSMGFGDVSTISYHGWTADGVGNELGQLAGAGFKGILGGKVLAFKETCDGAGVNSAAVDRIVTITVASGVGS